MACFIPNTILAIFMVTIYCDYTSTESMTIIKKSAFINKWSSYEKKKKPPPSLSFWGFPGNRVVVRVCFKVVTGLPSGLILEGDTSPCLPQPPPQASPPPSTHRGKPQDQKMNQSAQEKPVVEGGGKQGLCLAHPSRHKVGGTEPAFCGFNATKSAMLP